jgi:hypothetical protein
MNTSYLMAAPQVLAYANDNTASIDEHWVRTTLMFLRSNMVAAALVKRDFEDMIQAHGDIVNVRRPSAFTMKRTRDGQALETQDATSTKIQVPLDQWATVSFLINDGEASKSFANLSEDYLEPAALALAEATDRIVLGQVARLSTYTSGELGAMTASNAQRFLVETNKVLQDNKCPKAGRQLILSTNAEAALLQSSVVVEADKRGDGGSTLAEANIGRIYGMTTWVDQNVNSVDVASVDSDAFIVNTAALPKGVLIVTSTTTTTGVVDGSYIVVEGEGHAHVVSATSATPDVFTLVEATKRPIAAAAAITVYNSATVKTTAIVGYDNMVAIDGLASGTVLQVGQLLAHGVGAARQVYTITEIDDSAVDTEALVQLDRPLLTEMTATNPVFPGPAGDMNVAFHKDAVALVIRPLATPSTKQAESFVVSFGGLSIRMTSTYDGLNQATRITLDMLCGVQILNTKLACVMYS